MSILTMKRLRVIALSSDRDKLLESLMKLGCVEVSSPETEIPDPGQTSFALPDESRASDVNAKLSEITNALSVVEKYAPATKGLFAPRRAVTADRFFDSRQIEDAYQNAQTVNRLVRDIAAHQTELSRLAVRKASLMPWRQSDVPLHTPSTPSLYVSFGVCPSTVSFSDIEAAASSVSEAYKLELYRTDSEQHYFLLLCHTDESPAIISQLKNYGYSAVSFKDFTGTAEENIREIESRANDIENLITEAKTRIASFQTSRELLENAVDALNAELERENARENLLRTESAVFLSGWVPERDMKRVEPLLNKFGCAYEFSDPAEGDSPPVRLHNTRLIYPFTMVTEMYSLPEYGTLDPNPLISVFFALFFGLMYADIGYGLVLLIISIVAVRKFNLRRGSMPEQLFMLMGICGVASIFWGAMFGSFFGDVVGVFSESILGKRVDLMPLAFNPLSGSGPLTLLVLCLGLGTVQIIFGMGIKAYMLIRDGKPWDALMDVGSWWLVFAGIALLALGKGWYVMVAGFAAVVLTQGRHSKGIFGKLLSGLGKLYDITAYLSDILSYSRLMALCMASGVIASVFNILGGMTGPIFFWPIFLIGHGFNMAINIIGTYVHGARLQYLEFFGKWYSDGGRPFKPLQIVTKYVDVVKNEQEEITL